MNTSSFIKKYCKPTTQTVTEDYLQSMMTHIVDYETIREYLIAIPYQDYLQTLYWKAISKYVRSIYKSCRCGNTEKLHVHHNTYMYVGIEHLHIKCLDVLCEGCHSLIHSCENAPKSSDRGVGYCKEEDKQVQRYNSIKVKKKSKNKSKVKSQNQLIIELYVKHKMKDELKKFKEKSKIMTSQQKYMLIKQLLSK